MSIVMLFILQCIHSFLETRVPRDLSHHVRCTSQFDCDTRKLVVGTSGDIVWAIATNSAQKIKFYSFWICLLLHQ